MRTAVHRQDVLGICAVENHLGVGRDQELTSTAKCDLPQTVVNLALKNDVLVCVRFIEEQHRSRPGVEEREKRQHLMEPATGGCDVEVPTLLAAVRFAILDADVGIGPWCVVRPKEVDLEYLAHIGFQSIPRGSVTRNFKEEVSEDVTRLSLPDEQVLVARVIERFLWANTRERRDVDDLGLLDPQWKLRYSVSTTVQEFYVDLLPIAVPNGNAKGPVVAV
jgi:hypothetical protein